MKTKTLTIIFIILIGVPFAVAGTGLILLSTRAWDPIWNPFRPMPPKPELSPEQTIEKMLENMKNVKTLHCDIEVIMSYPEGEKSIASNFDIDHSNNALKGNMHYSIETREVTMEASADFIEIKDLIFVNFRKIEPDTYFNTSNAPPTNQWVAYGEGSSDYYSNYFMIGEIGDLFKSMNDYTAEETNPVIEKIEDTEVYHYILNIKKTPPGKCDLYIGIKDYLCRKMTYEIKETYSYTDTDTFMKIEYSDFNKPLDIRAPDDYITEEELMQINYQQDPYEGVNLKIKADIAGLRSEAELYAADNNNSYVGFCNKINKEKDQGITTEIITKPPIFCNDTVKEWAGCSQLIIDPTTSSLPYYFCSDSTGMLREIMGKCDEGWDYTQCPVGGSFEKTRNSLFNNLLNGIINR